MESGERSILKKQYSVITISYNVLKIREVEEVSEYISVIGHVE